MDLGLMPGPPVWFEEGLRTRRTASSTQSRGPFDRIWRNVRTSSTDGWKVRVGNFEKLK